jgi:hypothetical protein
MAIVKVQKCCPLCNSDYEAIDETQLSDKEKYLMYWNYKLGTEELSQAIKSSIGIRDMELLKKDNRLKLSEELEDEIADYYGILVEGYPQVEWLQFIISGL